MLGSTGHLKRKGNVELSGSPLGGQLTGVCLLGHARFSHSSPVMVFVAPRTSATPATFLLLALFFPGPPPPPGQTHTYTETHAHTQTHTQQPISPEAKIHELVRSYYLLDFWSISKKEILNPTLLVEENFNDQYQITEVEQICF